MSRGQMWPRLVGACSTHLLDAKRECVGHPVCFDAFHIKNTPLPSSVRVSSVFLPTLSRHSPEHRRNFREQGETFANFRFVLFGSDLRASEVRMRFDLTVLLQELLCRIAPASSSRDIASTLRDGGLIVAAGCSLHFIAAIILLALIVAGVGGGDLVLELRLQSKLDISAAPRRSVPTVPSLP